MDSVWVSRICTDSVWILMDLSDLCAFCMDAVSIWILYGFNMDSIGLILYGFCMDPDDIHGFCLDSVWILSGFYMDSVWSLYLYGFCMYQ